MLQTIRNNIPQADGRTANSGKDSSKDRLSVEFNASHVCIDCHFYSVLVAGKLYDTRRTGR
jgi:hypothetical protein